MRGFRRYVLWERSEHKVGNSIWYGNEITRMEIKDATTQGCGFLNV